MLIKDMNKQDLITGIKLLEELLELEPQKEDELCPYVNSLTYGTLLEAMKYALVKQNQYENL